MFLCQWHIDIEYGKQSQVLEVMRDWHADMKSSEFKRAKSTRLIAGHIGRSPSHLVAEHVFESLSDWEAAISSMKDPKFRGHSDRLAPFIVGGSQHWEIFRIVDM